VEDIEGLERSAGVLLLVARFEWNVPLRLSRTPGRFSDVFCDLNRWP